MDTFTSSAWLRLLILSLSTFLITACGGGGGGSSSSTDPEISIADTQAIDSATSVEVAVTLSQASGQTVTVNYATADGTAIAGTDYESASGTLTFAAGETSKTITITLVDGRDASTLKAFTVTLSEPAHATLADSQATISLLDAEHSAMFNNPSYLANWGIKGIFTNATTCASCHTGTTTVMNYSGTDVSPATQWKHSVMAHSLNDPYFNAVVEEEVHIFPDKQVFIEDTCLRCHAPMASTHAHQNIELLTEDPTGLSTDGGYPFATAISEPHAREGISCTACHQMQNQDLGQVASMSGHYTIKSEEENNGVSPSIFGPFKSPVGNAMQNNTIYTPEYAAHIRESAMCATCHNLYTPTLNLEGDPHLVDGNIAQFPEQTPYWDWLNSQYSDPATGKTCQACHMASPADGYTTPITTRPADATARPSGVDDADSVFSVHEFVGGNSYLLGLLKTYMEELGIADKTTESGFDEKITQTRAMLSQAATIETNPTNNAGTLTIPVTITNLTGHRLPTSFPSRRMWVHLKVTDVNGSVVFESGAADANGRLAKDEQFNNYKCLKIEKDDPEFDYSTCYEPHHDTIDDANQVQIYEPVLGDVNGGITHVLLHANQYLKDNRLPPIGWTLENRHPNPVTPGMYDDDINGLATSDTNFAAGKEGAGSDGKDTVTYEVDTSGATGPFTVEAELLYQSIRPSFVYGMHADDPEHGIEGDSYVRRFKYMYENTPPIPEQIDAVSTSVN
ncbi:Calx-beta domain-containing protein [Thiomicrorhabdus sp. zzn3]|uniref:Calx-beta domain-containing protein n=1 Tax=Thiomicrorhabdus sp. zzn3 TaxID=3039775 RepID=UPI002436365D|nr:Calx-beta domain-containing protein [Thiomicrorhabdus sp. zzn3]MDG6777198.1 Calx-beta domain-containing protein [Thiomicrorhabdus sp. zzn3]